MELNATAISQTQEPNAGNDLKEAIYDLSPYQHSFLYYLTELHASLQKYDPRLFKHVYAAAQLSWTYLLTGPGFPTWSDL